ncbi:MAG: YceI family protein [Balneolaceae bacterium]|nr:YceI family protein [Balneolaceae bacterium]
MSNISAILTRGAAAGLLLTLICASTAGAQAFRTESGHVAFHSSVPLHAFTGTSETLNGRISLADSTVDFYVDLITLETGIAKRDKDMRQTLETEEHPFAEFYGKLTTPVNLQAEGAQQVSAEGTFTIHGISREITVEGTLNRTPEGLAVEASWTLNMTDYDIKPPGILFYRVSEEIEIELQATLQPENN